MKRSFNFNSLTDGGTHNKVCLVEQSPAPLGHQLVDVSSTFRVLTSDLEELAKDIEKADVVAHASAVNRLELLAEQMKYLHSQACKVVVELRQGMSLNHAACNFKKVPGRIYHLYQRPSGQKYFSMLSPEEWNNSVPHQFLGSFRLENDMTWTPVEKIETKERNLALINNILNSDSVAEDESYKRMLVDSH